MSALKLEYVGGPTGSPAVVFLHGVNGTGLGTWTNELTGYCWPRDLASLGRVQVWVVTYPAATHFGRDSMPLRARALSIASSLAVQEELRAVDIVLVGHSFGGLVIKQLLRHATDFPDSAGALLDRIAGTVFVATPHTGAALGSALVVLRPLIESSELAFDLRSFQDALAELGAWYRAQYPKLPRALVLQERFGLRLFGIRFPWRVVRPEAADPGLPGVLPVPIDADHSEIAKPSSRSELQCAMLEQFLQTAFEVPAKHARKPQRAAAVIVRGTGTDRQVLLIRTRARRWSFPKGKIRSEESTGAAAAREAREEAGVLCSPRPEALPGYVHQRMGLKRHPEQGKLQYVRPVLCDLLEEHASPPEDYRNPTWFSLDEAAKKLAARRDPDSAAEFEKVLQAVRAFVA